MDDIIKSFLAEKFFKPSFCLPKNGTVVPKHVQIWPFYIHIAYVSAFYCLINEVDLVYKSKKWATVLQIETHFTITFSYKPAVYSVELEMNPVLSRRMSFCFGFAVDNLISALFLTLQHPMALSNTFIRSFPSK
jgi:hypothetical protein